MRFITLTCHALGYVFCLQIQKSINQSKNLEFFETTVTEFQHFADLQQVSFVRNEQ